MISPEGMRYYRRVTLLLASVLTALVFFLASRFFSVAALVVGMLIPAAFGLGYLVIWRLLLAENAYGHVRNDNAPKDAKPGQ